MARYKKPLAEGLPSAAMQKLDERNEKSNQIHKTIYEILVTNGISCELKEIKCFPLYTTYKYEFESYNIKKSTLTDIEEMLPIYLNCQKATISFVPAEKAFEVAVSNDDRSPILLGNLTNSIEYQVVNSDTKFILGVDEHNKTIVMDFNKNHHILLSGAKASGKTIALKTIVTSLLSNAMLNTIQFIFFNKETELGSFLKCSRFLNRNAPNTERELHDVLWDCRTEVGRRLKLFEAENVSNLEEYNKILAAKNEVLPHLILVVDELNDILCSRLNKNQIQNYLTEIVQKGGVVGIHLLCTTRYPNTDVIRGSFKRFFNTIISFKTQTSSESRAVDIEGAETLIGKGDGLYYDSDINAFRRFQAATVSDDDIELMVEYIETKSIID